MYYFLTDSHKVDNFIKKEFSNIIYSPQSKKKIISWICGSIKAICYSKQNDTIICWFDFQAILCYWLSKFLLQRRKIVCINLMLKNKNTLKNKIVSWLYKKALISTNFKASVTSIAYGEWLNSKLKISKSYSLIRDVYHHKYEQSDNLGSNNVVFCGGRNGRDWSFLFQIAQIMPEIQFSVVMPQDSYNQFKSNISPNVKVRCNISYNEFLNELSQASIVCLPLDTEAPAGLIVMFQAVANYKLVITTKTVTTIEYVTKDRGITLNRNVEEWKNTILYYLNNKDKAKIKANSFNKWIKDECNSTIFVRKIKEMAEIYD